MLLSNFGRSGKGMQIVGERKVSGSPKMSREGRETARSGAAAGATAIGSAQENRRRSGGYASPTVDREEMERRGAYLGSRKEGDAALERRLRALVSRCGVKWGKGKGRR
ncbi:hypothetical protein ACJRO7_035318 [Eucalyptus globulus]|uniref:Uncharacterized protein n=1 Tax=Eucalyptus globulus TaxID=34317 RepID=A0ABD3JGP9_EUCGL